MLPRLPHRPPSRRRRAARRPPRRPPPPAQRRTTRWSGWPSQLQQRAEHELSRHRTSVGQNGGRVPQGGNRARNRVGGGGSAATVSAGSWAWRQWGTMPCPCRSNQHGIVKPKSDLRPNPKLVAKRRIQRSIPQPCGSPAPPPPSPTLQRCAPPPLSLPPAQWGLDRVPYGSADFRVACCYRISTVCQMAAGRAILC